MNICCQEFDCIPIESFRATLLKLAGCERLLGRYAENSMNSAYATLPHSSHIIGLIGSIKLSIGIMPLSISQ